VLRNHVRSRARTATLLAAAALLLLTGPAPVTTRHAGQLGHVRLVKIFNQCTTSCVTDSPIDANSSGSDDAWGDFVFDTDESTTDWGADINTDPPPPSGPCNFSNDLNGLIQAHEGLRLSVYNDTVGHPSVGYGFNLDRPGAAADLASIGADYNAIRSGQASLTQSQASQLFALDLANARQVAQRMVGGFAGLSAARQAVVVDMAFNLGPRMGTFHNMLGAIGAGDFSGASQEMLDSLWATQVKGRANEDATLMENCN
jgi:GH24 family phage-related lysozyme (muramidase)